MLAKVLLKLLFKIVIIIFLLLAFVFVGFVDISFADELSPTDTKTIPPALYPGGSLWCQNLGFYVYYYRYELLFITIGLYLVFLVITEQIMPFTNPLSPKDWELVQKAVEALPDTHTFQEAALRYPELVNGTNLKSELLPDVIRVKMAIMDQTIPATHWSLPVGVLDNVGNVYKVYASNSIGPQVITSFTEAFNAQYPMEIQRLASKLGPHEGFAISSTILVDPFTNANNAYYLVDLVKGTTTPAHSLITDGSQGSLDNSTRIIGRIFFKYTPGVSSNNLLHDS